MKSTERASSSNAHPEPPTQEQITARAHRLWIEAGRPEGRDQEHWAEAERQLQAGRGNVTDAERAADQRVDGLAAPRRASDERRTPKGEQL